MGKLSRSAASDQDVRIKRKRPKTRTTASERLRDSVDKLSTPRPGDVSKGMYEAWKSLGFAEVPREQFPSDAADKKSPHDRVERAHKARVKGFNISVSKDQPDASATRSKKKYEPLIKACQSRGVPLGTPHTQERMIAIMAVADDLGMALTLAQVRKHLQRHHKK